MNNDRILAMMAAQFAEMRRDFGAMFLTFLFPLFFVIILGASALVGAAPSFEFGVLDRARTPDALQFVDALASQNVAVQSFDDPATMAQMLEQRKIAASVTIPENWTAKSETPIQVQTDEKTSWLTGTVLDAARARLALDTVGETRTMPFALTAIESGDAEFAFIYPGMLALALVQMGLFMTATPILKARERGTLRYLLLTPATKAELISSQILFRIAVATLQLALLLMVGSFIVSLSLQDWLIVVGLSLLGIIMLVSIGYLLAGLARSTESGMALIMIANFAMLFVGNIFWDPEGSTALTVVAHIMPVSYLADAYRQIISDTTGLWPFWRDVVMMVLFTLLALMAAMRTFTFDMRSPELQPRRT